MHTPKTRTSAPTVVLRPGTITGPAGMQSLGLARFADDPGAQGTAPQEPAGQANGDQATPDPAGDSESGQQATEPKPEPWKMDDLPPELQEYIRGLRDESKANRITQQENAAQRARDEQLAAISKTFNLTDDEKNNLAEQLSQHVAAITGERDEARAEVQAFKNEQTIRTAADAAAIDADKALDLKATDKALEGVDLTDPKAVQDALLTVAEQHPHIKAASTVGRTGGDHHSGEGNRPKPKTLTDAIASQYQ